MKGDLYVAKNLLGNNISRHQGVIKWHVSAAKGIMYSGIRTTVSWAYVDPQASRNISEAMKHNIFPMMYWVLYPNEDPRKQVDHFLKPY